MLIFYSLVVIRTSTLLGSSKQWKLIKQDQLTLDKEKCQIVELIGLSNKHVFQVQTIFYQHWKLKVKRHNFNCKYAKWITSSNTETIHWEHILQIKGKWIASKTSMKTIYFIVNFVLDFGTYINGKKTSEYNACMRPIETKLSKTNLLWEL